MQENATPAKYQSMGNGLDAVPRSCLYDKTALPVWCRKGVFSIRIFSLSRLLSHGVGGEIFHPGGVALGLDVDAVRLGVLGFQVTIVIGKGFPQVEESAVFFPAQWQPAHC